MAKIAVILSVIGIFAYVARRIWLAILQMRVGAVPEGVDVPEVAMEADRGWQVTRTVSGDVAEVRVEHPTEGVVQSWRINIREPGSVNLMERTMRKAGLIVSDLTTT
jgi:hypothetical protein